jgi:ABC-type transport system involved in cytochrome c biogenesis permease subunit
MGEAEEEVRLVQTAIQLLNVLLPLGYLLAGMGYLVVFLDSPEWAKRWATRVTTYVVGFHALYLLLATLAFGHFPVATPWEGFSFIAFAIAVVYMGLEWRSREKATGVFLLGLVLFFQILSSAFVTHTREVDEVLRSPLFSVHVISALLGYAALSVGAVYGAMYTLLYGELKKSRVSLIFRRLPSLETLSRLNMGAVLFGWAALTAGILLGSLWAGRLMSTGWLAGPYYTDPKFILTAVLWGLYGITLMGRYLLRWPNRQLAVLSIVAFVLLLSSSLAVNLILPSFHRFS